MRTLPRLHAVLIAANEVRRRGEPLEVLRLEPRLPIRRGQLGERIRPRPPSEALPATRECLGRRHALAPDDSPGTRAARGAPSRASVSPDTRASYARRVAARFDPTRHSRAPEISAEPAAASGTAAASECRSPINGGRLGSASGNARNDHMRARRLGACRRPQPRAKATTPAATVERLLIVPSVAERTPPPPGRLFGHARALRGRRAADAAATQPGCSISAPTGGANGRPQPAAGAPSSPARRPDRRAFYMGYCPDRRGHVRCGASDHRHACSTPWKARARPRTPIRGGFRLTSRPAATCSGRTWRVLGSRRRERRSPRAGTG
jgi:hypothetical protein